MKISIPQIIDAYKQHNFQFILDALQDKKLVLQQEKEKAKEAKWRKNEIDSASDTEEVREPNCCRGTLYQNDELLRTLYFFSALIHAFQGEANKRNYLIAHNCFVMALRNPVRATSGSNLSLIDNYRNLLPVDAEPVIRMLTMHDVAPYIASVVAKERVTTNFIFGMIDTQQWRPRSKTISFNETKTKYLYQDDRLEKALDVEIRRVILGGQESLYHDACVLIKTWRDLQNQPKQDLIPKPPKPPRISTTKSTIFTHHELQISDNAMAASPFGIKRPFNDC